MFYNLLIENAKKDGIDKNVVGSIILNNNKVLILSRKMDDFMGGIDELPSGNMEANEGIYDALVREVKEETNLDIENVISYINSFDYTSSSNKKVRQYNFFVKVKSINNIKLSEHDAYKWLSFDEVKKSSIITDEVKLAIEIYKFNFINN